MVPESPLIGDWLDKLQEDITVIKIEIRDEKIQTRAEDQLKKHGQHLIDMGQRILCKHSGSESLHAALNSYAQWIASKFIGVDKQLTPWGATQTRPVAFIRRHLPDYSRNEVGARRVEELIEVLRLRPNGEDGKPVSVSWTRNCIKQFRAFLRWLNKTLEFGWKRPTDLELAQVRIPLAPQEKSALARSTLVQTYTLDELQTLRMAR
jgi:hypothetical protein